MTSHPPDTRLFITSIRDKYWVRTQNNLAHKERKTLCNECISLENEVLINIYFTPSYTYIIIKIINKLKSVIRKNYKSCISYLITSYL